MDNASAVIVVRQPHQDHRTVVGSPLPGIRETSGRRLRRPVLGGLAGVGPALVVGGGAGLGVVRLALGGLRLVVGLGDLVGQHVVDGGVVVGVEVAAQAVVGGVLGDRVDAAGDQLGLLGVRRRASGSGSSLLIGSLPWVDSSDRAATRGR